MSAQNENQQPSEWLELTFESSGDVSVPAGRYQHSAVAVSADARNDGNEMLVLGGEDENMIFLSDLFAFNIETMKWRPIKDGGARRKKRRPSVDGAQPIKRPMIDGHTAVVLSGPQSTQRSMLVVGGSSSVSVDSTTADTFRVNLETNEWELLQTSGEVPSARTNHSAVLIRSGSSATSMLIFGGKLLADRRLSNELYSFNIDTREWKHVSSSGDVPSVRSGHSAVMDAQTGRMILFGGVSESGRFLSDAFAFDPATRVWTRLRTTGAAVPSPRERHSAAILPHRRLMLVFGGWTASGPSNELFELHLDTLEWRRTSLRNGGSVAPAPRYGHSAVVLTLSDSSSDAMVVFGGKGEGFKPLSDLFALFHSSRASKATTTVALDTAALRAAAAAEGDAESDDAAEERRQREAARERERLERLEREEAERQAREQERLERQRREAAEEAAWREQLQQKREELLRKQREYKERLDEEDRKRKLEFEAFLKQQQEAQRKLNEARPSVPIQTSDDDFLSRYEAERRQREAERLQRLEAEKREQERQLRERMERIETERRLREEQRERDRAEREAQRRAEEERLQREIEQRRLEREQRERAAREAEEQRKLEAERAQREAVEREREQIAQRQRELEERLELEKRAIEEERLRKEQQKRDRERAIEEQKQREIEEQRQREAEARAKAQAEAEAAEAAARALEEAERARERAEREEQERLRREAEEAAAAEEQRRQREAEEAEARAKAEAEAAAEAQRAKEEAEAKAAAEAAAREAEAEAEAEAAARAAEEARAAAEAKAREEEQAKAREEAEAAAEAKAREEAEAQRAKEEAAEAKAREEAAAKERAAAEERAKEEAAAAAAAAAARAQEEAAREQASKAVDQQSSDVPEESAASDTASTPLTASTATTTTTSGDNLIAARLESAGSTKLTVARKTSKPARKTRKPTAASAKVADVLDSLSSSSSSSSAIEAPTDDKFAQIEEQSKKQIEEAEAAEPKKKFVPPAGAVSMFGGGAMPLPIKKKQPKTEEPEKSTTNEPAPSSPETSKKDLEQELTTSGRRGGKTTLKYLNEAAIQTALENLRNPSTPINWILFGFGESRYTLRILMTGKDTDTDTVKRFLFPTQVNYIVMRTPSVDSGAPAKVVIVTWIGEAAEGVQKTRSNAHRALFHEFVQSKVSVAAQLQPTSLDEFTIGFIRQKVFGIADPAAASEAPAPAPAAAAAANTAALTSSGGRSKRSATVAAIPSAGSSAGKETIQFEGEEEVRKGLAEIRDESNDFNWVKLGFEDKKYRLMAPAAKGSDGLAGVQSQLSATDCCYFVLGFSYEEAGYGAPVTKYVFIQWIGDQIRPFIKVKAGEVKHSLYMFTNEILQVAAEIQASRPEEVSEEAILDKLTGSRTRGRKGSEAPKPKPQKFANFGKCQKSELSFAEESALAGAVKALLTSNDDEAAAAAKKWLLVGYAENSTDVMQLLECGDGGVDALRSRLADDKILFALFTLNHSTEAILREKPYYGLLTWIGPQTAPMEKALCSHHWKVFAAFVQKIADESNASIQGQYQTDTTDDITEPVLKKELRLYS